MPIEEVAAILEKFNEEEEKVSKLFEEALERRSSYKLLLSDAQKDFPSFEEAKQRNKSLLKDLETVKGNLRSKAIFSPAEMEWENICKRYQDEPSLPVKTWKCNIPIFV